MATQSLDHPSRPLSGGAAWLLIPTLGWIWLAVVCSHEWAGVMNYAHGWLVLPLAVYFLFKRLSVATPSLTLPSVSGLAWAVLALGALCVLPLEIGRIAPLYWRVFPWAIFCVVAATTLADAYLSGGRRYAVAVIFPLLFLSTGIPWPTAFEYPVTTGLMNGIASFLGEILPLAGIPARREGTMIVLLNCTVGIEEACSGIRSLQSAFMIALAAGELFRVRLAGRVVLLVAGVVLALAANAGRTIALTVAGVEGGDAAMAKVHDPAGLIALLILAGGILLLARLMRGKEPQAFAGPPAPTHHVFLPGILAVAATGVLGVAGAHAWYFHQERASANLPHGEVLAISSAGAVERLPIPTSLQAGLKPSTGGFARIVLPDGQPANGYHLYWNDSINNAEQLYHRPDFCMPVGGWKFVGPHTAITERIGMQEVRWAALPYIKGDRRGILLWAAWIDGRPTPFSMDTGSGVQRNTLLRLILNGRRTFSYEVAAVLVPYSGSQPPLELARRVANEMFSQK